MPRTIARRLRRRFGRTRLLSTLLRRAEAPTKKCPQQPCCVRAGCWGGENTPKCGKMQRSDIVEGTRSLARDAEAEVDDDEAAPPKAPPAAPIKDEDDEPDKDLDDMESAFAAARTASKTGPKAEEKAKAKEKEQATRRVGKGIGAPALAKVEESVLRAGATTAGSAGTRSGIVGSPVGAPIRRREQKR